MDGILTEATRHLLGQGLGWVMAVIFGALAWMMYLKRDTDRLAAETRSNELQEKRVVEAAQTIATLNQATQANMRMAAALEEQATARQALMQLVIQIERDMDRNNEAWKPQVLELKRLLEEIDRGVDEIRRKVLV